MFKIAIISGLLVSAISPPAFAAKPVGASTTATWKTPFDSPHRLVRDYLQPASDYSAGHRGVDYEINPDEPLFAPADGVIALSKTIVNRGVLAIKHGNSLVSELEPACSDLEVGDVVTAGQQIGWPCAAGETYKQHCPDDLCLHFSLRSEGKYLSPLALIGGLNPSRLLPYARG